MYYYVNMRIGITLTSSVNVDPEYTRHAREVGAALAKQFFGIVYGGTNYGMMGELAASYKENRGTDLVGVLAEDIMKVTKGYKAFDRLDDKFMMPTMEDRMRKIMELSDGFIIFPGGYGTLAEMDTFIGRKAEKLFDKPIVLYNLKGFYDKYIEFVRYMIESRFSKIPFESIVHTDDNMERVVDYFLTYKSNFVPDKFVQS